VDAGAVFGLTQPALLDTQICSTTGTTTAVSSVPRGTACPAGTALSPDQSGAFKEVYLGDSPSPRLSVGFGVNWNSPFGPFRIDIAKALLKEPGDDTRLFTFNVGTQF
jgi:outer membrane protein insertion porin family